MKRMLLWIGVIVLLLLLIAFALPFVVDANRFRPELESELTRVMARDVKVGDLQLAIFSGGVTAASLSVADDPAFSRSAFLNTRSLTLGVDLWPLIFSHKLNVTRLVIDQPQISLLQSASGDWNITSLGGKSAARAGPATAADSAGLDLSVKLIRITNGRLSFAELGSRAKARVLEDVNVEVRDFSPGSEFPFTLAAQLAGGGDFNLDGAAGPIHSTDSAQTPAHVKVRMSGFDLAAAGMESSSGLAGIVSLDGTASSNGRTLSLKGKIEAEKLKLSRNGTPAAEPVEFDFVLDHDMRRHSGNLHRGAIYIGSASASVTGTYGAQGESTVVNMALFGPEMPVPQLAAMLPALGIVLPAGSSFEGGTAGVKLTFEGPVSAMVISGAVGLNNTRLVGFDLESKISAIEKLAGLKTGPNTDIQSFAANVRMAPEGSSVQDIKLVAPAIGELSGGGTVSPAQALDFKMLAAIGAKGDTSVPFRIQGTAANPVFKLDMKAFASDLGKTGGGLLKGLLGKKE